MRHLFLLILFMGFQVFGAEPTPIENSHGHEAFMNVESPVTILIAIPQEPPAPLKESIPVRKDPRAVWVRGYWDWSFNLKEFVWCSGAWRVAPVDHEWIEGTWVKRDQGWVRLKGFWSKVPENKLTYIKETPPDPYDERPKNRPGDDYFWMSGYWKHTGTKYVWYSGKWEKMDQDWIYVPPKYVWRPEGYVFVPAFWDWPLDKRGTAYACVTIPEGTTEITYLPGWILEPMMLVERCVLYYPDYYYFYYYYSFYYVDWWWGCAWCPPWWGWNDWWWMPWSDHWGLWWWWSHPGFMGPWWLDPWLMNMIFGPPFALMNAMENIAPPPIIGPNGPIPPGILIDRAGGEPVIPEDQLEQIQEEASRDVEQGSTDRPGGEEVPHNELEENAPPAPQTTPAPPIGATPGEQPAVPDGEEEAPQAETPPRPEVTPTPPQQPPSYQPPTQTQPPSYQPPSYQPPSYQPPSYQPPSYQPPSYQPPVRPRPQPPSYQPPSYQPPSYQPPTHTPSYQPPTHTPPSYQPPSEIPETHLPQSTPQYTPQYTPQTPNVTPQYTPSQPQLRRYQPNQGQQQQQQQLY